MDAQRGAVGDRLDDLLEHPVREQCDHRHRGCRFRPLGTERDQHREGPRRPGTEIGDVGGEEVDHRDRPREGDAEQPARQGRSQRR